MLGAPVQNHHCARFDRVDKPGRQALGAWNLWLAAGPSSQCRPDIGFHGVAGGAVICLGRRNRMLAGHGGMGCIRIDLCTLLPKIAMVGQHVDRMGSLRHSGIPAFTGSSGCGLDIHFGSIGPHDDAVHPPPAIRE